METIRRISFQAHRGLGFTSRQPVSHLGWPLGSTNEKTWGAAAVHRWAGSRLLFSHHLTHMPGRLVTANEKQNADGSTADSPGGKPCTQLASQLDAGSHTGLQMGLEETLADSGLHA